MLFSVGTILVRFVNQLLDFDNELFLEWTCLTSPSPPLISYSNVSPCLLLMPQSRKRDLWWGGELFGLQPKETRFGLSD